MMLAFRWPPVRLGGPARDQADPPDQRTEVERLRVYVARLQTELDKARGDLALARGDADQLRVHLADRAGAAELARAHKTLLRYENLLAAYEGRQTPYCSRCAPQPAPTGAML